jgi:hypothetical protein
MQYILDCFCGVYCGACPNLLATKAGKLEMEQQCYGCKSEQPTGFCSTCPIKACAISKGYEFCSQCSELSTCEYMNSFISDQQYPYGQCVLKNLEMIQVQGLATWLGDQEKRWRCDHCGEPHSWYQETCSKCGFAVNNYLADL